MNCTTHHICDCLQAKMDNYQLIHEAQSAEIEKLKQDHRDMEAWGDDNLKLAISRGKENQSLREQVEALSKELTATRLSDRAGTEIIDAMYALLRKAGADLVVNRVTD